MNQPTSRAETTLSAQLVLADGESCSDTDRIAVPRDAYGRPPLVVCETGIKRTDGPGSG